MRKETINNLKNEGFWITLVELIRDKSDTSSTEAIKLIEQLQDFYYFSEVEIRDMIDLIIADLEKENK